MPLPASRKLFLGPGFICLPGSPARLCTVISSGVAVTMYDKQQCFGGVGHYSHPLRRSDVSTPSFAAPALVGLVRLFEKAGSNPRDLETYLYGGADNPDIWCADHGRGLLNSRMGFEILGKMGVRVAGTDIGGRFARKLVFYTATGESMVAKVTDLDEDEWYPEPARTDECHGNFSGM